MSNYFPGKGLYTFFSGGLNLQDIQTAFSSTNDSGPLNESNESNEYNESNVVYAEECMKESSNEENEKLKEENKKLKEENENLKKRIEIDNALDKIHKSIPSMNEVNEMLDKVFLSN